MTQNDSDPTVIVDSARQLQTSLESAKLHIVHSRAQFDERTSSEDANLNLPLSLSDGSRLVDPAIASADVAAQLAFFRKLKFQYLEQKAKDQYIKIIVSDDAPNINAADNEKLRLANEKKKQELREAKLKLTEMHRNMQTLAPLVEQDYNKAKSLTSEASTLAQKVLDARLQLIRLRQTHPQPRLTVPAANAQLDSQIIEMQDLEQKKQDLKRKIESVSAKVKGGAREVERLKVERADVEKQARAAKNEVEDSRVIGLYDWYTASLALHRTLFSLESFQAPSENELRLTYSLDPPSDSPHAGSTGRTNHRLVITLLFVPNTRQLADARVEGLEMEVGDVVGAHVQANDVPGLIAALLAQARAAH